MFADVRRLLRRATRRCCRRRFLPGHLNQQICLAVPVRTPNSEETSFDNNRNRWRAFRCMKMKSAMPTRWGAATTVAAQPPAPAPVTGKAVTDAWIGLPLTRITALHPDGRGRY